MTPTVREHFGVAAMLAIVLIVGFVGGSCAAHERDRFGPESMIDVAVQFRASTQDGDITAFITENLQVPSGRSGGGRDFIPGISEVNADYLSKVVMINFDSGSSDEERALVLEAVVSSEHVQDVLFGVNPSELLVESVAPE